MGIEALPSSAIRTIGATQVLNDPASVVKELIDNALDAWSTSISIEIHSNTLESIQVRDNGHGIPPDDRLLVARPHCTSKISGEDDLKVIGGTSLGFRGEALASAAEMSGSLTIGTRVEGEVVATSLMINQQGEVIGQDRASLPIGTTVKITDFIKAHPVRKQVALKNAEKTIAKIKHTLKSYAFARPHVRLSLRVLKAKNDKGNWTYAPSPGGNAEDAAFKIVGTACASQCIWSVIEERGYVLQAFLPGPDTEVSKYSNIGSFVSVDARPVSTARGTPKQILKIFREALKKANPKAEGLKDPFLFLNIQCPSASYDANVEPAKDDVLFEDPDTLIGVVRPLFEAVYSSLETAPPVEQQPEIERPPSQTSRYRIERDGFVTSLEPTPSGSRKETASPWTPFPRIETPPMTEDCEVLVPLGRTFRPNMYGCDEEDFDTVAERPQTGRTEADFEELRQARHDVSVSNPWILAKMNAAVRQQSAVLYDEEHVQANGDKLPVQSGDIDRMSEPENALPTPGPSSPTKPSLTAQHQRMAPGASPATERRFIRSPMLPPPIMPTVHEEVDNFEVSSESQRQHATAYNYTLSTQDDARALGTPLHMIPASSPRRRLSPKKPKRQGQLNTPFKSLVNDGPPRDKVWFDHLEHIDERRPTKRPYRSRDDDGLVTQGELGDIVDDPRPPTPPRRNRDMRDSLTPRGHTGYPSVTDLIESRQYAQQRQAGVGSGLGDLLQDHDGENKDQATEDLNWRGFIPASELAALEQRFGPLKDDTSRPYKRRKSSEMRALREITGNAAPHEDTDDDGYQAMVGSRAASSRRRTTNGSPSKPRRTKSSRLPLERVPKGQGTHNLTLELSSSPDNISGIAGKIDEERSLLAWSESPLNAYDIFVASVDQAATQDLTAKLGQLLERHVPDGEIIQDLGQMVQSALVTRSQAALKAGA